MPKRVTSGVVHFRGLASGQHSFELRRTIATVASHWRRGVRFDPLEN